MDESEQAAALENTAIEAMTQLVAEHGYTRDDLVNLTRTAEENA